MRIGNTGWFCIRDNQVEFVTDLELKIGDKVLLVVDGEAGKMTLLPQVTLEVSRVYSAGVLVSTVDSKQIYNVSLTGYCPSYKPGTAVNLFLVGQSGGSSQLRERLQ